MSKRVLTTESGAPVADNQNSASAGVGGPILIQAQHLLEKLRASTGSASRSAWCTPAAPARTATSR
ncbi:hypothetical protein SGLAM104S_10372 [Streptomyces glaucescens]